MMCRNLIARGIRPVELLIEAIISEASLVCEVGRSVIPTVEQRLENLHKQKYSEKAGRVTASEPRMRLGS